MDNANKLAILIDAENISPQYVNVILDEAANIGNIIYKRIYGNWTSPQMAAWKSVILENAIQPIQQFNNASGKNASDSALIIDAMDLLYQADLDGFVIVSSDSDFTRLASRLRESGKYVLGMGNSQTPVSFISACHKFLYLDVLYADSQKTEEETETHPAEQEGSASHASQEPRKNGKNLKKITIKSKVLKKIQANAFRKVKKGARIYVPRAKYKAYSKYLKAAKITKDIKVIRK